MKSFSVSKQSSDQRRLMVWALIPYCVDDTRLVAETWDDEQTKSEMADSFLSLGYSWVWQPVVATNLAGVVQQIARFTSCRDTVVFNFCDGTDGKDAPGISVVQALETAGLVFTGANSRFYAISTSKIAMKDLFVRAGLPTPAFEVLPQSGLVQGICDRLGIPLIIKPDISSASYGISLRSVVSTDESAALRRDELRSGEMGTVFEDDPIFAERFIDGDEFTVLLGGFWDRSEDIWSLPPAHRAFDESIPQDERFLSYDRYWGYYKEESPPEGGRAFYRYETCSPEEAEILVDLAKRAYCAVDGHGYARVDIRRDRFTGEYFVLEVNANCGLSGSDQTSCGSILRMAGLSFADLLGRIIDQTLRRAKAQACRPEAESE